MKHLRHCQNHRPFFVAWWRLFLWSICCFLKLKKGMLSRFIDTFTLIFFNARRRVKEKLLASSRNAYGFVHDQEKLCAALNRWKVKPILHQSQTNLHPPPPPVGVLSYMSHTGMCRPKRYSICAVSVWKRVQIFFGLEQTTGVYWRIFNWHLLRDYYRRPS